MVVTLVGDNLQGIPLNVNFIDPYSGISCIANRTQNHNHVYLVPPVNRLIQREIVTLPQEVLTNDANATKLIFY